MKKLLFIVGIIVLAGGIFIGGIFAGTALDFMTSLLQVSMLKEEMVDARIAFMQISDLDEGNIEKAKSFMNSQLDVKILTIAGSLENYPNQETKEHALALLAEIAEHRVKYPASDEEMKGIIKEALDRALEDKE